MKTIKSQQAGEPKLITLEGAKKLWPGASDYWLNRNIVGEEQEVAESYAKYVRSHGDSDMAQRRAESGHSQ